MPETVSPLCDLRVFVDEAAGPIASMDACVVVGEWFVVGESVRCPLSEGSVGPVPVLLLGTLIDDGASGFGNHAGAVAGKKLLIRLCFLGDQDLDIVLLVVGSLQRPQRSGQSRWRCGCAGEMRAEGFAGFDDRS